VLPSLQCCKLEELKISVVNILTLSVVRKRFAKDANRLSARHASHHRTLAVAEAKKLIEVHEVRTDRIRATHFVCHCLFAYALANLEELIFDQHEPHHFNRELLHAASRWDQGIVFESNPAYAAVVRGAQVVAARE